MLRRKFLKFCPELVNALCKPVLEFASMPVWQEGFAPHDVGRYPYATGQVYAARKRLHNGQTPLPYYQYPAQGDVYDPHNQMPVEECGNMLIMLEAALSFGAGDALIRTYAPLLDKWVRYLDRYGEDPGEQLCTDDFAGHLAHNVNLSAKAFVGMACYARILTRLGYAHDAEMWDRRAQEMAASWLARAGQGEGTSLTFDGQGWSMKYNLVWDINPAALHLLLSAYSTALFEPVVHLFQKRHGVGIGDDAANHLPFTFVRNGSHFPMTRVRDPMQQRTEKPDQDDSDPAFPREWSAYSVRRNGMNTPPCTLLAINATYFPVLVSYQSENGTRVSVCRRYSASGAISVRNSPGSRVRHADHTSQSDLV